LKKGLGRLTINFLLAKYFQVIVVELEVLLFQKIDKGFCIPVLNQVVMFSCHSIFYSDIWLRQKNSVTFWSEIKIYSGKKQALIYDFMSYKYYIITRDIYQDLRQECNTVDPSYSHTPWD